MWHYQACLSSKNSRMSSPTLINNCLVLRVLFEILLLSFLLQQVWGALQAAGLSYSHWLCARCSAPFIEKQTPGKGKKKKKRGEGGEEEKKRSCWATHAIRTLPLKPSRRRLCSWKTSVSDEWCANHFYVNIGSWSFLPGFVTKLASGQKI